MNSTCIIIVTYNGMPWLDPCLTSCNGYPVIVVDNQSTDGTVSFIEQHYPNVVVLPQTKNLGFGAANNIGIKHAIDTDAEYVFLLNQDAYLQPNTIENLIEVHLKHPDYGIVSPMHLNGEGSKLDTNFSYYFKQNNDILYDALHTKRLEPIYEVAFVNAAAWLVPIKTVETVGGFDPMFFHYGEDDNYCQRVLYHGFKIGVVPHVFVNHDREARALKKTASTEEKSMYKERHLKAKWGNLNFEPTNEIIKCKKDLIKLILKLILKLKFRKANYYFLELQLVKSLEDKIQNSRNTNKEQGSHYLA